QFQGVTWQTGSGAPGMKLRRVDVLVVGAGPKGLALHLELRLRGVDAILVEKHAAGHSRRPPFVNSRMRLTPSLPHEITHRAGYRFRDFWEQHGRQEVKHYEFSRGLHTA